jgi:circadian clock protein KaiC
MAEGLDLVRRIKNKGGDAPLVRQPQEEAVMETRPVRMGYVQTGIPGLDKVLGGGMSLEDVLLLSGDVGAGKSVMGLQYLVKGAVDYGEPGVLISFEDRKYDLAARAKRFGWNLEELAQNHQLLIFEYPPHEVAKFLQEGGVIADEVANAKAKRVVIDSFSSFAMMFENDAYQRRQAIVSVMDTIKGWGATAMLISEGFVDPNGIPRDKYGAEFVADGFLYAHHERKGTTRDRYLEVVKLKGGSPDAKLHAVDIGSRGARILDQGRTI